MMNTRFPVMAFAVSSLLLLAGTSSFAADTPATSSTTPPAVDKPVSPQDGEAAGGPRADRRAERFEQRGREMFEKTDTNKDGFISKEEMIASHKARIDDMFEKMDTNKDGKLSQDELKAGREAMRNKFREKYKEGMSGKPAGGPEGKPPVEGEPKPAQ